MQQILKRVLLHTIKIDNLLCKESFLSVIADFDKNSMENRLKSMSNLELSLVLAAVACEKRFPDDDDFVNFEQIFSEYIQFAKLHKTTKTAAIQTMQKLEECQIFASKSENCYHSLAMMVFLTMGTAGQMTWFFDDK